MEEVMKCLEQCGVVPVVALEREEDAPALMQALCEGGLPIAEVTFRTAAAEAAIRRIAKEFPQVCVGAGTVLTVEQAERALAAGAKFIVSPGFSRELVLYCQKRQIPVFPGGVTPTEIMQILEMGIRVVKFFPAQDMGGLEAIKALAAPFPGVRFMPTGGINEKNLREYLQNPKIAACGGIWMVSKALIEAGDFDTIRRKTAEAAAIVKEVRG